MDLAEASEQQAEGDRPGDHTEDHVFREERQGIDPPPLNDTTFRERIWWCQNLGGQVKPEHAQCVGSLREEWSSRQELRLAVIA